MVTLFCLVVAAMFLGTVAYGGLRLTGVADADSPLMERLRTNADAFWEVVGEVGFDGAYELVAAGLEVMGQVLGYLLEALLQLLLGLLSGF